MVEQTHRNKAEEKAKPFQISEEVRDNIRDILYGKRFSPSKLINGLKQVPELRYLYQSPAGVWEGYTLEQHTKMDMRQFERYFARDWKSPYLTKNQMRMTLALHDIGKPIAVWQGRKSYQHGYTAAIIPGVLNLLGSNDTVIQRTLGLVHQDYMGTFMRGKASAEQIATEIKNRANLLQVPVADYMDVLQKYFMVDAGSYTIDAGGKQSLDFLFEFQRPTNNRSGTMRFSQAAQQRFDQLLEKLALKEKRINTDAA